MRKIYLFTTCWWYFRVQISQVLRSGISCHVAAYGASNQWTTDGTLLETRVAVLADGEVAARNEDYSARGRHTHDAQTLLCGAGLCGRGCGHCRHIAARCRRATVISGNKVVCGASAELLGAGHEVLVGVDALFGLPVLVRPEAFKQVLCERKIVSCRIQCKVEVRCNCTVVISILYVYCKIKQLQV